MDKNIRVLMVEDSEDEMILIIRELKRAGYLVICHRVETEEELRHACAWSEWDVAIADYSLPKYDGLSALRLIRGLGLDIPLLLVSGRIGEETAVEALKAGADNYILKDKLFRLVPVIEREIEDAKLRRQHREADEALQISQAALRETAGLLQAVLGNVADGIFSLDADGGILSFNPMAERIFAYSLSDVEGQHISTLIPDLKPNSRTKGGLSPSVRRKFIAKGLHWESQGARSDGSQVWMDLALTEMKVDGRQMFTGIVRDITEQKRIQIALRTSEEKVVSILEDMTSLFFALDEYYCFTYVNSHAARIFGHDSDELLGRNIWDELPDAKDGLFEPFMKAASSQQRVDFEEHFPQISKWFEVHIYPSQEGMSVHLTDITQRKEAEEQLRQAQKMDAIGKLTGSIAHEFNNLLTVISGYAELAQKKLGDSEHVTTCLAEISKASDQSAQLTSQMLAFARKQFLQPQFVNVNKIINGQQTLLRPFVGTDISLLVHAEHPECFVRIDPAQFSQAILNLAINGCQAMVEGGALVIASRITKPTRSVVPRGVDVQPGPYVAVSVSDTGPGIDSKTKEHIYEPFFTTKEFGKGTGLGLSMVQGMVRQSGGFIHLKTKVGVGTIFTVYLPLTEERPSELITDTLAPSFRALGETILLAEDQQAVRRLARLSLEEAGYEVLEAENGAKAAKLYSLQTNKIDLLLTDISMPVMDGVTLAKILTTENPDLKVLFMTAHADSAVSNNHCSLGGWNTVRKPFDPDGLVRSVRDTLSASSI